MSDHKLDKRRRVLIRYARGIGRRVWPSAVFAICIVAILAICFHLRLFRTVKTGTSIFTPHSQHEAANRVTISSPSPRNGSFVSEPALQQHDDGNHETDWSPSPRNDSFESKPAPQQHEDGNRVTIWSPPPCNGSFVSEPAPHSPNGVPYAIIREAVIDRRPLSHRQYREVYHANAFQRIILYLSVHLSVSPTRDNAKVALITPDNQAVPGVIIRMDYVQRVDPFLLQGPYNPGKVTRRGHQVSECQVVISLAPEEHMSQRDFDKHVQSISSDGARVNLELLLRRFDGAQVIFKPSFDLSCATAWERPDIFPSLDRLREPACHTSVTNTTGAVVLSGSALYGKKKTTPRYYAEVAHFGARALSGPIKFDAVAMGVVVNNSVSDRQLCKNETCVTDMNKRNEELLENVRQVVEAELDAIGFDQSLRRNLLLVPLCRLGSDASNSELADPCLLSHRYGQYHATFFSYAMLAPYFKWAVSYDMDEFFAANPRNGRFITAPADAALDEVNKYGRGYMYFSWLNFEVQSDSLRSLTTDVVNGNAPELRHKEEEEGFDCLRFTRDPTGKSAVRCDVGIGFTIHRPVIRRHGEALGILEQIQGEIRMKQLRTWHPRLGGSMGECIYVNKNVTSPTE